MDEYGGKWITTYTGKKFHFLNPQPEEIDIVDIAHSLSITCRFGGQCRELYSVAEHSLRVAEIVPWRYKLHALLHDASEAYLPDLPRPMKAGLPDFKTLENDILLAIWRKFIPVFHFRDNWNKLIKEADNVLLATEARDLMANMDGWAPLPEPLIDIIVPYSSSAMAENVFLLRFELLQKEV